METLIDGQTQSADRFESMSPTSDRRAIVYAIANQKGGVGKTTTAINLSAALGVFDKKVLIVDCDPQGNATRGLGFTAEPPHLYHVLVERHAAELAVRETRFAGVSLLPTDRELVGAEVELVGVEAWELCLRTAIAPLLSSYDFIFIDCPPSLGHLTVAALTAADRVLVPLQSEYFALEGLSELVATVRRVQARANPLLDIAGVVLTMYDDRNRLSRDVAEEARRHFGGQVYRTVVPRNIRLAEAPSYGLPIFQYDVKSRGALSYLAMARELMERLS